MVDEIIAKTREHVMDLKKDQLHSFGDRVEYIIKSSGWNVGAFKKKFADQKISEQTIYNSTQGEANLQYDKLVSLIERLNKITDQPISLDWLLLGKGQPYISIGNREIHGLNPEKFVAIPLLDLEVSAGPGTEVSSENVTNHIAFKKQFLRRLGLEKDHAVACTVRGESMRLEYPHDSTVLIDTSAITPYPGRDYVILHEGMLRLKRIESVNADQIVIKSMYSDQDSFNEREVLQLCECVHIRGMVRWKGIVV